MEYRQRDVSYTKPCPSGDGTQPIFEYDESGELVCVGRQDTDSLIQCHVEECNISAILARALNGDSSALSQRVGQYIDAVDLPSDLAQAFDAGSAGSQAFDSLTDSQKELVRAGDFEGLVKSFEQDQEAQKPVENQADLEARLKALTGKEVKYE